MSYEIIYDKQFVKVNEKTFIPILLWGSNNCYEYSPRGVERRSRSWENFAYITGAKKLASSMEEMIENAIKQRDEKKASNEKRERNEWYDEFDEKRWGYWIGVAIGSANTSRTTFGMYKGLFKTGCEKALTVEQLAEENVFVNIHTYGSADTDEKLHEVGLDRVSFTPRTTKQLEDFLKNEAPKVMEVTRLYASLDGMYESTPKRIRAKYFPKVKREMQEVRSKIGYAIKITEVGKGFFGYLSSFRGGTFRYSRNDETGGRQFLMKKDAEVFAKKIEGRRLTFKFEVVQVEYRNERLFRIPAGKKIVLPKKEKVKKLTKKTLLASLDLKAEGEERANFFNPEAKCFLDPLGVALHDFVKGSELLERYDDLRLGLGIFREKYPEEYMVLLD